MEGKDVSKSNISQLFPYIDDNGYMRARGRIFIADFEFDTKHPTTIMVLIVCGMNYNKSSRFWASEMRCGALQVAAFLAENTVRNSKSSTYGRLSTQKSEVSDFPIFCS